MSELVTVSKTVPAAQELVFKAFVEPSLLKQWLCDDCKVDIRNDGQLFLSWNTGMCVVGKYSLLDRPSHLAFSWYEIGDNGGAQVDVLLTADADQTRIDVTLTGGDADFWRGSLDALAYTLETGLDYRMMSRPLMGIFPMPVSEADAAQLGMAKVQGVIITGVAEGGGAEAAGLKKDDVLLKIGATPVDHPTALAAAVAPYKGGDVVPVEIFRAGVTQTIELTFGKRPIPEVPTRDELVERLRVGNVEVSDAVAREIAGVPEEILARRPEPNEWCVQEVLAHVTFGERFNHMVTWAVAAGDDLPLWSNNGDLHMIPVRAAYPTAAELLDALRRAQAGSLALIESLPESVVQNPTAWGIIVATLGGANNHVRIHTEQISPRD